MFSPEAFDLDLSQLYSLSIVKLLNCQIVKSGTCKNCGGQILEDFSGYLPIEPPLTRTLHCILIIIFSTYQHHWISSRWKPWGDQKQTQSGPVTTVLLSPHFPHFKNSYGGTYQKEISYHIWRKSSQLFLRRVDTSKQTFAFCFS